MDDLGPGLGATGPNGIHDRSYERRRPVYSISVKSAIHTTTTRPSQIAILGGLPPRQDYRHLRNILQTLTNAMNHYFGP